MGDRQQPAREAVGLAELIEVAVGAQKDILNQVAGFFRAGGGVVTHAVDEAYITVKELAKCLRLAVERSTDQVAILQPVARAIPPRAVRCARGPVGHGH